MPKVIARLHSQALFLQTTGAAFFSDSYLSFSIWKEHLKKGRKFVLFLLYNLLFCSFSFWQYEDEDSRLSLSGIKGKGEEVRSMVLLLVVMTLTFSSPVDFLFQPSLQLHALQIGLLSIGFCAILVYLLYPAHRS